MEAQLKRDPAGRSEDEKTVPFSCSSGLKRSFSGVIYGLSDCRILGKLVLKKGALEVSDPAPCNVCSLNASRAPKAIDYKIRKAEKPERLPKPRTTPQIEARILNALRNLVLRLMDKILHYLKDPKLWELRYIPYYGVMQDFVHQP